MRTSPAQGESPEFKATRELSPDGAAHVAKVSAFQACAFSNPQTQGCHPGLATFAPFVPEDLIPLSITTTPCLRGEIAQGLRFRVALLTSGRA